MRRIYFTPDAVTPLSIPALQLDTALWEQAYGFVMAAPVGAGLRRFWQHQYGTEAEMALSGAGLLKLQADIGRLLPLCQGQPELQAFLSRWSGAIGDARARRWKMFVIAE
ncbi:MULTISPECIES: hypothetical protein [unclassified Janthinobacterium]|uniref:hypothetical protein n=1 Tax=unclassified Janthinobacterium TaxID=2610881 RepID=UPI00162239CC|nr:MULTISPECIES: hypothetical protein [unclassified Janthinobacterium]MBB5608673.1 hypothetical protein [Janthinobacterium sp. S3T4]MBB5613924.1 hypothetical protein [Janthinobacterium sp. S3M3]